MKYYSEILKTPFDTVEELEEAEAQLKKKEEDKRAAAETRKKDVERVKELIKARLEAEQECKKAKAAAYKAYLEICDDADATVKAKKKAEIDELNEFCKKYKDGFHETVTLDDVTYKYNYDVNTKAETYLDPFVRLLNWF